MKIGIKLAFTLFVGLISLSFISAQGDGSGSGGKEPPSGGRPGKDFTASKQMKRGKVGASFGKVGGAIRFCFDEDVCEHAISMVFDKLTEVNASVNGSVVQRAQKFNDAEFEVSDPISEQDSNGSYRVRVDYKANISVGMTEFTKNASFKMTSLIYLNASTAMNGNQTLDIAKDSLKFAINITDWPWLDGSTDNFLTFGVQLAVRTKSGYKGTQKPEQKKGRGRGGKLTRFELGEGEYLDVPELCVTDGDENTVQVASAPLGDDGVIIDWVFPHFSDYVYYDPVMGEESVDEQTTDATDAPNTTAAPTTEAPNTTAAPTTEAPSAASSVSASSMVTYAGAFVTMLALV